VQDCRRPTLSQALTSLSRQCQIPRKTSFPPSVTTPEFDRWQKAQGPYNVDGCCNPQGSNRQAVKGKTHWWDCIAEDFVGKNIWFNSPFEASLVRAILRRLHQGRQNDTGTNATLVLPPYVLEPLVRDQLDLMPYLKEAHRHPAGSRLFRNPAGTQWEVAVLCTVRDNSAEANTAPVCQTCNLSSGTRKNKLLSCSHCGAQSHTGCMKVLDDAAHLWSLFPTRTRPRLLQAWQSKPAATARGRGTTRRTIPGVVETNKPAQNPIGTTETARRTPL
jgi:hypothetical protein